MSELILSPSAPATLIERAPTVDEFLALRAAVGWQNPERAVLADALAASRYAVCLAQAGQVIGCGRVISDGFMFYIQDVVVLPAFQHHGYGQLIMGAIMAYIRGAMPPAGFVGLMAARGTTEFYTRFGFVARPSEQFGPGMCLVSPV